MNLKQWAREQGIHPVTAYRWFQSGKLPVPARRVGHLILVDAPARPPCTLACPLRISVPIWIGRWRVSPLGQPRRGSPSHRDRGWLGAERKASEVPDSAA